MDTRSADYARLLERFDRGWRRLFDVQRPYRWNVRHLGLGLTLEVGCGVGRNLLNLGGRGAAVGVDHSPSAVAGARARGLEAFTPEQFRASDHARPARFDALLLAHVLEHMRFADARALVREYLPYVRTGGRAVFIVPQEAGFRSDATHVEFFGREELHRLADACGLRPLRCYSFPFPRPAGRLFPHNETVLVAAWGPAAPSSGAVEEVEPA